MCRKQKKILSIQNFTNITQFCSWTKCTTTKCLKQNSGYITDLMPQILGKSSVSKGAGDFRQHFPFLCVICIRRSANGLWMCIIHLKNVLDITKTHTAKTNTYMLKQCDKRACVFYSLLERNVNDFE